MGRGPGILNVVTNQNFLLTQYILNQQSQRQGQLRRLRQGEQSNENINEYETMQQNITYHAPKGLWGPAVEYVRVGEDGKMWIGNGEYETRVNYCPFTGTPAPQRMEPLPYKADPYAKTFIDEDSD